MAVVEFPPELLPDVAEWTLEFRSRVFTSDLNGASQTQELPGSRWRSSMTYGTRHGKAARVLNGFLASLRGQAGRFYLTPPDWEPLGTAIGSPQVGVGGPSLVLSFATDQYNDYSDTGYTVSQMSSSFMTKGWGANQPEALCIGDYFEINGELKVVTQTVSTDEYGNAMLHFSPPLRVGVSTGMAIRLEKPRAIMMLSSDDQAKWGTTPPIIYSSTFEAVEALDI